MENTAQSQIHKAKLGLVAALCVFVFFAFFDIVSVIINGMEYWVSIIDALVLLSIALCTFGVIRTKSVEVAYGYSVTMVCLIVVEFFVAIFLAVGSLLGPDMEEKTGYSQSFIIFSVLITFVCLAGACGLASYSGKQLERALLLVDQ